MWRRKAPRTFQVWVIFLRRLDAFTSSVTQELEIQVFRTKSSKGKKIARRASTLLSFSILKVVLQTEDTFFSSKREHSLASIQSNLLSLSMIVHISMLRIVLWNCKCKLAFASLICGKKSIRLSFLYSSLMIISSNIIKKKERKNGRRTWGWLEISCLRPQVFLRVTWQ